MAKARARQAARKVKDKWKAKQWYTLHAPAMFNKVVVAESPADDAGKLMGRIVTTTLQDLTGDFKQMHVKLNFQVNDISGSNADTRFVGHSLTSDYVRRMVRRNHTKVFSTVEVTTKDGAVVRLKPLAVTDRRAQSSQAAELRQRMAKSMRDLAAETTLAGLVKEVLDGGLTNRIYKACRPIYPLRRVEIGRTEVRNAPTSVFDDDVSALGTEPEPEPAAEEAPTDAQAPEDAEAEAVGEAEPEEEAEATVEDEKPAEEPAKAETTSEEEPPSEESGQTVEPKPE